MELDIDYALDILQAMADHEKSVLDLDDLAASGFDVSKEKFGYHSWLLSEEGLIEVWDARDLNHPMEYYPKSLNWAGHDFIGTYRSKGIRERAKQEIVSKGLGLTLGTMKAAVPLIVQRLLSGDTPPA